MKRILVIEDSPEIRENIAELLELANYEVFVAEHGREGVRVAFEKKPDLILCDVMMPELDGYGVLRILSKDSRSRHIPFLFLTARTEKEDFRKGMNLGADDYLTKPFLETDLLEAIENRLSKASSVLTPATQGSAFFNQGLGLQHLIEKLEEYEHCEIQKKNFLYQEGGQSHFVYLIKTGVLQSYQTNDFGKILCLDLFGANSLVGVSDAILGHAHQESIMSLENTSYNRIPTRKFAELIGNDLALLAILNKSICAGFQAARARVLSLAYDSVRKRTANALLAFQRAYNMADSLVIVRDDLANYCASTKESVIRTLSDFKTEKLIAIDKNQIRILDAEALANLPG